MPQRYNIVIVWGWHTEWCRLHAASTVKIWMKWFNNISPNWVEYRCQQTFTSWTLSMKSALWTRRTDAIQRSGICNGSLVMLILLMCYDIWLWTRRRILFRHNIFSMPMCDKFKTNDTKNNYKPYKTELSHQLTLSKPLLCIIRIISYLLNHHKSTITKYFFFIAKLQIKSEKLTIFHYFLAIAFTT